MALLTTSAVTLALAGVALADGGRGGGQLGVGAPGGIGYDGADGADAVDPNWLHAGGGGGGAGGGKGGLGAPGSGDPLVGAGGDGGDGGLNNYNGAAESDGKDGERGSATTMGSTEPGGSGGGGGAGGAGYYFTTGIDIDLATTLTPGLTYVLGGKGGAGGFGWAKGGAGGNGGDGGGAVVMTDGITVIVDIDTITGGAGGAGGAGALVGPPAVAGNGGTGGAGVIVGGTGDVTVRAVTVTGGNGGVGGTGRFANVAAVGGNGGDGGAGIDAEDGGDVIVETGTVKGGDGGAGGTTAGAQAGNGGTGGAGIDAMNADSVTVETGTTVAGGKGDAAGATTIAGTAGAGGVGIVASNGTVVTVGGTVSGGMDGTNTIRAHALDLTGGGNTLVLESGYHFDGAVVSDGTNGGDTLALGGDVDASFDPSLLDTTFADFTAFAKTGGSTWTLSADGLFAGPTTISGGTLLFDGVSLANSDVTVETDGTLAVSGAGGIKSLDVASSVTLRGPGANLNVDGDLSFGAGSTYNVAVDAAGNSSWIFAANATSSLAGGTVKVTAGTGTYDEATHYVILADNGRTGAFDGAEMAGPSFLAPTLHYDANEIYLTFAAAFSSAARSFNQLQAAGALDAWGLSGALAAGLLELDPVNAGAAYDALSGEAYASAQTAMLDDAHIVRDAMEARLMGPVEDTGAGAHMWAKLFGDWSSADGDGNARGYSNQTSGLLAGADTTLGDWRVGALLGYGRGTFDANGTGTAVIDGYHAGVYAGGHAGSLQVRGGADLTWHQLEVSRDVAFGNFDDELSGRYGAGMAQAFAELGYRLDLGGFAIEPFGNLAAVALHTDGFSESGGDAALDVAAADQNVVLATLGLHTSAAFTLGEVRATAEATIGWQHALADDPTSSMRFAGGEGFEVAGVPLATDSAIVKASLGLELAPGATVTLAYSGQLAAGALRQTATADVDVKF